MNSHTPRVGIVGAGQLARMTYQAGISLGMTVRLLADHAGDSAARVGADVVVGSHASWDDLARFADDCDVLTLDHEWVDPCHLERLEASGRCLRPGAATMDVARNKRRQRHELGGLGCPLPRFQVLSAADDVAGFGDAYGWPVVLKAAAGGYDGHGVWMVEQASAADQLVAELASRGITDLLVEERVPIEREIAVLVARRPNGETASYPVIETVQVHGICRELLVPAPIDSALAETARELGQRIASAIGVVGILAVELFLARGRLIVNELAARPHNSGHFSLGGCVTSQFEQHLRAILDYPLGDSCLVAPVVATVNVLGGVDGVDPRSRLPAALAVEGAQIHLYDKPARPGRKLGHVTALGRDAGDARGRARRAAAILVGEAHAESGR